MKRKAICSSRGGTGRDALGFLSNVDDQSGWTIGRGESARDDVFYIPAILSGGRGVAMPAADEYDVRDGRANKAMTGNTYAKNFDRHTGSILQMLPEPRFRVSPPQPKPKWAAWQ
jgi:hypothetical protein